MSSLMMSFVCVLAEVDRMAILILIVAGLAVLVFGAIIASFFRLWLQALLSGAHIPFLTLLEMRLRKTKVHVVVDARIRAVKGGLDIPVEALEAHDLAGGNVINVVMALIAARKANIDFPLETAAAMDLLGVNPFQLMKAFFQARVECGHLSVSAAADAAVEIKDPTEGVRKAVKAALAEAGAA